MGVNVIGLTNGNFLFQTLEKESRNKETKSTVENILAPKDLEKNDDKALKLVNSLKNKILEQEGLLKLVNRRIKHPTFRPTGEGILGSVLGYSGGIVSALALIAKGVKLSTAGILAVPLILATTLGGAYIGNKIAKSNNAPEQNDIEDQKLYVQKESIQKELSELNSKLNIAENSLFLSEN